MSDGLPRTADATRPQDAFGLMVLGGVEKMTWALNSGHPFSAKALADMQALRRRLEAFARALDAREAAAMPDLIED